MTNELTRQCEMAWERGHSMGLVKGLIIGTAFIAPSLVILLILLK